ncbi:MAG: hypothetical protein PHH13_05310, partial [Candidatus Peribacteraceae bacterium]|nr:hypothetical protein [Candidatus Peribacteraceae bacterium]
MDFLSPFRQAENAYSASERRLCAFGLGGPPEFSVPLDHETQGREQVLGKGSAFLRESLSTLERKMDNEAFWDTITDVLDRTYGDGVIKEGKGEHFVYACRMLDDDKAWFEQFNALTGAPAVLVSNPVIAELWKMMTPAEQSALLETLVRERLSAGLQLPGGPIVDSVNSFIQPAYEEVKKAVSQNRVPNPAKAKLLVDLLRAQGGGPLPARRVLSPAGEKFVLTGLRDRYIMASPSGAEELTMAAYIDFADAVDYNEALQVLVKSMTQVNDASVRNIIAQLPEGMLKGAFVHGVFDQKHLQTLLKYREQKLVRDRTVGAAKEKWTDLRRSVESKSPEAAVEGRYKSEVLLQEFSKLNGWQKLMVGSIAVGMAYVAFKTLFHKSTDAKGFIENGGFWKLLSLGALGAGVYFLGGDKLVHGASSNLAKEKRKELDRSVDLKGGGRDEYMHFMNHLETYLSEHGEDVRAHEIAASAAVADMPMGLLAENFTPEEKGRSGTLMLRGRLLAEMERKLGGKLRPGMRMQIDGTKWGRPLAHAFYLYGVYKSRNAEGNQMLHIGKVLPELRRRPSDWRGADFLDQANNYDRIASPEVRTIYENIMENGRSEAFTEEMTLAKFIISLTTHVPLAKRIAPPTPASIVAPVTRPARAAPAPTRPEPATPAPATPEPDRATPAPAMPEPDRATPAPATPEPDRATPAPATPEPDRATPAPATPEP